MTHPLAHQFHTLFRGLSRAYGTYRVQDIDQVEPGKKAKGKGITVKGEVTEALWEKHLTGEQRIGIVPVTDEATAYFGAIDVDQYSLDLHAVEHRVRTLGLPLVPCRSKSGGLHLYLFTTGVPAALLRQRLTDWSAALGFPGVEIFPKQSKLASEDDTGNWINMPYFDEELTTTYALYNGASMSASDFLARAMSMRVGEVELQAVAMQGVNLPEGSPPCLMAIAVNGAPEGMRNNALFGFGVLAKQVAEKTGEDMGELLERYNGDFMDPPLPMGEVKALLKSLRTKDYFYSCDTAPLSSYCDKRTCKRGAYGVGGGEGPEDPGVLVEQVTKILTDPPTWIFRIAGVNVELETDDFLSQTRFKRRVAEALNRIPRSLKQHKWEDLINGLLATAHEEEAPEDASSRGQFMTHLRDFCNKQSRGPTVESLATNGLYHNEDEGRVYFRSTYLERYLGQQKFFELKGQQLWKALRKIPGHDHGQSNIKGLNIQWWSLPMEVASKEDYTVPALPEEEF